jgi:membrane protease YdiL (CAAX protease family)
VPIVRQFPRNSWSFNNFSVSVDNPIFPAVNADFVPVMEELMFRGFVLDLASEAYGKWAAIFISAILFALIHPLYILTVLNAFWAGLVYGYLRICTNSLWPSILLHSLWNSHIILLAFYS